MRVTDEEQELPYLIDPEAPSKGRSEETVEPEESAFDLTAMSVDAVMPGV